jgi:hypothetical protein
LKRQELRISASTPAGTVSVGLWTDRTRLPAQLAALDSNPDGVRVYARRDQADLQASKRIEFALDGLGNVESEVAERRSIGLAARSCVE